MPSATGERLPTIISDVTLRTADPAALRAFYAETAGLQPVGDDALGTPDGRALLRLEHAADAPRPPAGERWTGLFHTALRFPSRAALGAALVRALRAGHRLSGASDHGVSEALYLRDPEGNGVELYWDRPQERWPMLPDGRIDMVSEPLDLDALVSLGAHDDTPTGEGVDIGHVHLKVGDLRRAVEAITGVLGLDVVAAVPGAAFASTGGYHHHFGLNVWHSLGQGPAPEGSTGLRRVRLTLDGPARDAVLQAAAAGGAEVLDGPGGEPALRLPDLGEFVLAG